MLSGYCPRRHAIVVYVILYDTNHYTYCDYYSHTVAFSNCYSRTFASSDYYSHTFASSDGYSYTVAFSNCYNCYSHTHLPSPANPGEASAWGNHRGGRSERVFMAVGWCVERRRELLPANMAA